MDFTFPSIHNPKNSNSTEAERIAYHEAGHAVTDIHFGLPFNKVSIIKQGDSLGRSSLSKVDLDRLEYGSPEDAEYARNLTAGLWSGIISEAIYSGDWNIDGSNSDLDAIFEIASRFLEDENFSEKIFNQQFTLFNNESMWAKLEDVANALIENEELSKEAMEFLLEKHKK